MKHVLQSERGMALAIAIVALVVVGALIAGAFFSGTQEQRVAENVRRVQASFGVAEEGVYDIIRGWSDPVTKAKYAGLYPYPAVAPARDTAAYGWETSASKTGSYSGKMFKLNDALYLIDMTAKDTMSLAGGRSPARFCQGRHPHAVGRIGHGQRAPHHSREPADAQGPDALGQLVYPLR